MLDSDGEAIETTAAIKLLKEAQRGFTTKISSYHSLCGIKGEDLPAWANEIKPKSNQIDTTWMPPKTQSCTLCNGSGVYRGIVSVNVCGNCFGSGLIASSGESLDETDLIAVYAYTNKRLKRYIAHLEAIHPELPSKFRDENERKYIDSIC